MSNHILSSEELQGFESSTTIASQYGKGNNKSIAIESFLNGEGQIKSRLVVTNQRVRVLETQFLDKAIEEYNKY